VQLIALNKNNINHWRFCVNTFAHIMHLYTHSISLSPSHTLSLSLSHIHTHNEWRTCTERFATMELLNSNRMNIMDYLHEGSLTLLLKSHISQAVLVRNKQTRL